MPETTAAKAKTDSRVSDLVVWLAAFVAFSPALQDLAVHWWDYEWPRYSLLFVALLARAVAKDHAGRPHPQLGIALVGFSLFAQLMVARAAVLPLGRPFVALAIIGLLIRKGSATLHTALLALFIIPIPQIVSSTVGARSLAISLFEIATRLIASFGPEARVIKEKFVFVGETGITIDAAHAGIPLIALFTGLVWYRAAREGRSWRATLIRVVVAALVAVPAQIAAVILAVACLGWAGSGVANFVLVYGVGLLVAPIWIYQTEKGSASAGALAREDAE